MSVKNTNTEEKVVKGKAEEKKATTKRKTKPARTIYIQSSGKETCLNDLFDQAEKIYADVYPKKVVKDVKVYVNMDEGAAYFVVNEDSDVDVRIVF